MSAVLYYIYNGEVVVHKQKLDPFLDIIKAMQIFIDNHFITKPSETIRNFNIESNVFNCATNAHRSDIFTLKLGDCRDQICFNIKKGAIIKDIIQYSLNESDHQDKQVRNQNQAEQFKTSLGNLKSPYGDRQRNSFLRDLFIETYPPNGNVNGQMAGVLAISNEHYRAPASVLFTNANGEHLGAGDTVLETYKNPNSIPILPYFSHPMRMQYLHNYNKNEYEKYSKLCPDQSHYDVCSNEIIKMKSLYEMGKTQSYTYYWENMISAHKKLSLVPAALKGNVVSETDSPYLDLSMRNRMSEDFRTSLKTQRNLAVNNSLYTSMPTGIDKQRCMPETTNSSKVMICNHVLNSPWTSCVPNNFKPFRRKIVNLENKVFQVEEVCVFLLFYIYLFV